MLSRAPNPRLLAAIAGASLLLVALIILGAGLVQANSLSSFGFGPGRAKPLEIYGEAPAFKLTDHLERPVSSDEFRGKKIVVANFIYTNCRDVCPLLSLRMQALQERLRQEGLLGSRVQLLSFTVDPARDTTAVLREYAQRYRADPDAWRFLTGPEAEMRPVLTKGFFQGIRKAPLPATATAEYDLQTAPSAAPGHEQQTIEAYDVMHGTRFALIDLQWRTRAFYDGRELDLDQTVRDIRQLLR